MNDKDFKKQQKRILALNEKWTSILGLSGWDVSFIFFRGAIPEHEDALATAAPDWKYMYCAFRWNCEQVADSSDEELEYAFLHEAMHAVVCEMRKAKWGDGHEERVCTILGHIIQRARSTGR